MAVFFFGVFFATGFRAGRLAVFRAECFAVFRAGRFADVFFFAGDFLAEGFRAAFFFACFAGRAPAVFFGFALPAPLATFLAGLAAGFFPAALAAVFFPAGLAAAFFAPVAGTAAFSGGGGFFRGRPLLRAAWPSAINLSNAAFASASSCACVEPRSLCERAFSARNSSSGVLDDMGLARAVVNRNDHPPDLQGGPQERETEYVTKGGGCLWGRVESEDFVPGRAGRTGRSAGRSGRSTLDAGPLATDRCPCVMRSPAPAEPGRVLYGMDRRRPPFPRLLTAAVPLLAMVAAVAACSAGFPDRVPPGNWGGLHAGMVVSDTGAAIEYDCAAGQIFGAMFLDAHGDFDLPGLLIETGPGPSPVNDSLIPKLAARYTGHTNGKTMSFTMTVLDGSVAPQTYTVTYGGNPHVMKCL